MASYSSHNINTKEMRTVVNQAHMLKLFPTEEQLVRLEQAIRFYRMKEVEAAQKAEAELAPQKLDEEGLFK